MAVHFNPNALVPQSRQDVIKVKQQQGMPAANLPNNAAPVVQAPRVATANDLTSDEKAALALIGTDPAIDEKTKKLTYPADETTTRKLLAALENQGIEPVEYFGKLIQAPGTEVAFSAAAVDELARQLGLQAGLHPERSTTARNTLELLKGQLVQRWLRNGENWETRTIDLTFQQAKETGEGQASAAAEPPPQERAKTPEWDLVEATRALRYYEKGKPVYKLGELQSHNLMQTELAKADPAAFIQKLLDTVGTDFALESTLAAGEMAFALGQQLRRSPTDKQRIEKALEGLPYGSDAKVLKAFKDGKDGYKSQFESQGLAPRNKALSPEPEAIASDAQSPMSPKVEKALVQFGKEFKIPGDAQAIRSALAKEGANIGLFANEADPTWLPDFASTNFSPQQKEWIETLGLKNMACLGDLYAALAIMVRKNDKPGQMHATTHLEWKLLQAQYEMSKPKKGVLQTPGPYFATPTMKFDETVR